MERPQRPPLVTSRTALLAVIGDPIEHSMSPIMHNAAIAALGLDYLYVAFQVRRDALRAACEGMRALGVRGFNVTIPHKVSIMAHLDEVVPLARRVGAVNTVALRDGRLVGRNTDGEGALRAFRDHGVPPAGKRFAVLGAGGAARAITAALSETAEHVTVLNRTRARGQALVDHLAEAARDLPSPATLECAELKRETLARVLPTVDVVVNCTPVGMFPHEGVSVLPADLLSAAPVVFDTVYNPLETQLLRDAAAAGCTTIGGLDMLVNQGAIAFEWWTGSAPDRALMKDRALAVLRQRRQGHESHQHGEAEPR